MPDAVPLIVEARLSRRGFLGALGSAAAGAGLIGLGGSLVSCKSDGASRPALGTGRVRGTVTGPNGSPVGAGRIYLLQSTGLNTNTYVDVDASGHYEFAGLSPGARQVRFWGGSSYYVPEPAPNPVRITVSADTPVEVNFSIAPASPDLRKKEIFAGDDFFQEQPFGDLNALVTVPIGTEVCWYNVGQHIHTVTGGPWGDSGDVDDEFMWVADRVGTFDYRCTHHDPLMRAVLQVTA